MIPDGPAGTLLTAEAAAALVSRIRGRTYQRSLIDNWVARGHLAAAGRADDGLERFTELSVLAAERKTRRRAQARVT